MIKYNNTNNASTTLTAWISPSSTTLIVENGDILPTAPFLLTLEHFDNEKVTVREIVKCIAKVWNILTIQRGAWTCVQDDSATPKAQNNTPHSFSVWDCASIYWTSEQVQDIQNEIEKKLNIDDFQAWTYVYGATSTWTDAYSITIPWTLTSYAVGQVFRFMADVENTWNATLNVNWIWAIEILKNHDKHLESGDIEAWQIVEVAFDGINFQMNSQVATVVDLWNINSLKMRGVVGELYTLDDILYFQNLKNEEDFLIKTNVWKDNEYTHVQRITSWIASNQIKIYISKVWNPATNLNIEIRKWISVTSSWREYRYWDENNIIATKKIPFTEISSTFEQKVITFDDNINFIKWEKVNVTFYQTDVSDNVITSWTDYFVLWCYNDWGEWNSYVEENQWTKTPWFFIPVCASDLFLNTTLLKVDYSTKNWDFFYKKEANQETIIWYNRIDDAFTYLNNTWWSVTYTIQATYNWSSSAWYRFYYRINWWSWVDMIGSNKVNTCTFTYNITLQDWDTVEICSNSSNSYADNVPATKENSYYTVTWTIDVKKIMELKWNPFEIKPITQDVTTILIWWNNWIFLNPNEEIYWNTKIIKKTISGGTFLYQATKNTYISYTSHIWNNYNWKMVCCWLTLFDTTQPWTTRTQSWTMFVPKWWIISITHNWPNTSNYTVLEIYS